MTSYSRIAVLALVATMGICFLASDVLAQTKIGVVDLQLAVASTKEGKRAKERLEKLAHKKQKELDDSVEAIKKMEEDMKKQLPVLTDAGKQEMLEKYRKEGLALQEMYVNNQKALAEEKGKLLKPILEKMGGIINDLALSDGYTVILDVSDGAVLYYEPSTDVTAKVIKMYNAKK